MSNTSSTLACQLGALDTSERQREQVLLARFRELAIDAGWSGEEHRFLVPSDGATLSELGEFFALERRCCPFLRFTLSVDADEQATVSIGGPAGTREFVAATFMTEAR